MNKFQREAEKSDILTEVGRLIIPFIQVFAIYVIFNGHLSPGGGFAGGTILGVSMILHRLIFGWDNLISRLTYERMMKWMCSSLLIYGALKGYSFLTGGMHWEVWDIPLGTPGKLFSGGLILPLNIAVGIIVAITMYVFFKLFYEGTI